LGHPEWEVLAKAYYALQSMGDVDRLDSQIFEDIHKNHVWLYDEQSITAWVGKHGVDIAKFTATYRSFGVNTRRLFLCELPHLIPENLLRLPIRRPFHHYELIRGRQHFLLISTHYVFPVNRQSGYTRDSVIDRLLLRLGLGRAQALHFPT
jgi:hypothetical protein